MSRTRACRWALAAGPVAVLLLTGCGIQETDVIEAGGPAQVQTFVNHGDDALLFFRLPNGQLAPVVRPLGPARVFGDEYRQGDGADSPVTTEKVISALLSGPGPADKAAGLGTALPRSTADGVRARFSTGGSGNDSADGHGLTSGPGEVELRLPLAVAALDATAVRQLICTAAYSKDPDGRVQVRVTGQDGATTSGPCDLDPRAGPAPTSTGTAGVRR